MKKILIIEDDPVVAHIYRTRLEKSGYTVEVCEDGQSGFYRIHEFHPQGVLLDLMLPKMNGVDILKKIRAEAEFSHIPVIVFTNAFVPNMIQDAMSAGAEARLCGTCPRGSAWPSCRRTGRSSRCYTPAMTDNPVPAIERTLTDVDAMLRRCQENQPGELDPSIASPRDLPGPRQA